MATTAADYLLNEAEESENEEDALPRKKKRRVISSDDEDDDKEDEQQIQREMAGFVVDEPEEADNDEDDRESDGESEEAEIEEDEMELLQENLGIDVNHRRQRRRLQVDDEDEEDPQGGGGRERIGRELFDDDAESEVDQTEETVRGGSGGATAVNESLYDERDEEEEDEEGEEGEIDDFIVDDEGGERGDKPARRKKKTTAGMGISDLAIEEMRECFGADIDDFLVQDLDADEEEEEDYDEEDGPRAQSKKRVKQTKQSLLEVIEPSELERGFLQQQDKKIQLDDKPERFQLRTVPVTEAEEAELNEEALWIYHNAFCDLPISNQPEKSADDPPANSFTRNTGAQHRDRPRESKPREAIPKIRDALNFMRNELFEVPFISFYRKEYVDPELNLNDLYRVYEWDEKWCVLRQRKGNLVRLFKRMQYYQAQLILEKTERETQRGQDGELEPEDDPPDALYNVRILEDMDIDRISDANTLEELNDVRQWFSLYYDYYIADMESWERRQQAAQTAQETGEDVEAAMSAVTQMEQKMPHRTNTYHRCIKQGLGKLAHEFGLTPRQFGENLRDMRAVHEPKRQDIDPSDLALMYGLVEPPYEDARQVLKNVILIVAYQLSREPLVRQVVRRRYRQGATVSITPTTKGRKEINEDHPIYTSKYIKNKPIVELYKDEFLRYVQAEDAGLISMKIEVAGGESGDMGQRSLIGDIQREMLYWRDEHDLFSQQWNAIRKEAIRICFERISYEAMEKETRSKLLSEAKNSVIQGCCEKMFDMLAVGPYTADYHMTEEDDDHMKSGGSSVRVLGVAFSSDQSQAAFAALIDSKGEVRDYVKLTHLLKRSRSRNPQEVMLKKQEIENFKDFVARKRPHVVALAAENLEATHLQQEFTQAIAELEEINSLSQRIPVELVDNTLGKIFSSSRRAGEQLRDYPLVLREAICVGRILQDPLIEYCQLWTQEEEILCLDLHPLANATANNSRDFLIPREDLLQPLLFQFVMRVNECGVDINRCIDSEHYAPLLQFVCGIGPRKAAHLLKVIKQKDGFLSGRTKLVTTCNMGPKVFMNCAGFIRIDPVTLQDKTDWHLEVLDASRVHPETYEWARKMAVDALEYDDAEDVNPTAALEEILKSPEKLKDLDLDAFANELKRQGFGDKSITLYDIRHELNHRYADMRVPYHSPEAIDVFHMVTKETPASFFQGKLITATVTGIAHKRPTAEERSGATPTRSDSTGLWQCQFCLQNDFAEISDVWSHYDQGQCEGQPTGVRVRLDNGISGFVSLRNLSDSRVEDPLDRVTVGQPVYARVLSVQPDRFTCMLTTRSSDLRDDQNSFRPRHDQYFDYKAKESDDRADPKQPSSVQAMEKSRPYMKRVIAHPLFKNIGYDEVVRHMEAAEQGETLFRPSRRGANHLTLTWKVGEGILQHVDIQERDKPNDFSLGRVLKIDGEEFEALDEIAARFVQPMASYVRDILTYKYYYEHPVRKNETNTIDTYLASEKQNTPSKIAYCLTACVDFPGKFFLSCMPKRRAQHEFVTVVPEGFRFRGQIYSSLGQLLRYFKEHYREVPRQSSSSAQSTPYQPGQISGSEYGTGSISGTGSMSMSMDTSLSNTPRNYPNTPANMFAGPVTPSAAWQNYSPMDIGTGNAIQSPAGFPQQSPTIRSGHTPSPNMRPPLLPASLQPQQRVW